MTAGASMACTAIGFMTAEHNRCRGYVLPRRQPCTCTCHTPTPRPARTAGSTVGPVTEAVGR